jgi:hypothetical protein
MSDRPLRLLIGDILEAVAKIERYTAFFFVFFQAHFVL